MTDAAVHPVGLYQLPAFFIYLLRCSTDNFRYELSVYEGKPWISATAFLPAGNYQLKDFSIVEEKICTLAAFKTRVYVNSGLTGGDTGVWPLGMRLWNSSTHSTFYDPDAHESLGAGFYSFYRAITSLSSQYLNSNTVGVRANAHYNNYRPSGGELKTESLLLNFARDPLKMLDEWADASAVMIKPNVRFDVQTGYLTKHLVHVRRSNHTGGHDQAGATAAGVHSPGIRNQDRDHRRMAITAHREGRHGRFAWFRRGPGR